MYSAIAVTLVILDTLIVHVTYLLTVPFIFSVKPDIADIYDDVIVIAGRRLILTCRVVTGSPSPSVTWYINGSLAADVSRSPIIDPVAGTLTVRSATHEDCGRYTCVSVNAAGTDVAHVNVHVIGLSTEQQQFVDSFIYRTKCWKSTLLIK